MEELSPTAVDSTALAQAQALAPVMTQELRALDSDLHLEIRIFTSTTIIYLTPVLVVHLHLHLPPQRTTIIIAARARDATPVQAPVLAPTVGMCFCSGAIRRGQGCQGPRSVLPPSLSLMILLHHQFKGGNLSTSYRGELLVPPCRHLHRRLLILRVPLLIITAAELQILEMGCLLAAKLPDSFLAGL